MGWLAQVSGPLLIAGLLLGAAVACKWEAVPALVGVIGLWVLPPGRDRTVLRTTGIAFVALPALVYVAAHAGPLIQSGFDVPEFFRTGIRTAINYHRQFRVNHQRSSPAWTWLWLQTPPSYISEAGGGRVAAPGGAGQPGALVGLPVVPPPPAGGVVAAAGPHGGNGPASPCSPSTYRGW